MEIDNINQEAVTKTISKEKKCKKEKMVVSGVLTNSWEKKRKVKEKGKNKTNPNAEPQSIARRHKKAFLSEQCKEIKKTAEWESLEIS